MTECSQCRRVRMRRGAVIRRILLYQPGARANYDMAACMFRFCCFSFLFLHVVLCTFTLPLAPIKGWMVAILGRMTTRGRPSLTRRLTQTRCCFKNAFGLLAAGQLFFFAITQMSPRLYHDTILSMSSLYPLPQSVSGTQRENSTR